MITFRLTQDEYIRLKTACKIEQSSISTIARQTMLRWANAVVQRPRVDECLGDISERLDLVLGLLNKSANRQK